MPIYMCVNSLQVPPRLMTLSFRSPSDRPRPSRASLQLRDVADVAVRMREILDDATATLLLAQHLPLAAAAAG